MSEEGSSNQMALPQASPLFPNHPLLRRSSGEPQVNTRWTVSPAVR